jgi:predicted transcriptional regulator of viral defense system
MLKNLKTELLEAYFKNQPYKAYNYHQFFRIFEKEKRDWGLKKYDSSDKAIADVVSQGIFTLHHYIDSKGEQQHIISYQTNEDYTILSGIKFGSYFAYASAMQFHKLTTSADKTIYINCERQSYEPVRKNNKMTQDSIDEAFYGDPKQSSNINYYKKKPVIVINGKRTDKLGVIPHIENDSCYYYTDLERTLIDIVVRTVYAHGTKGVLKAFKKAKDRVNLEKLKNYLKELNYVYPYQQCIGYYLDKAGYRINQSKIFMEDFKYDFYLVHGMEYPGYDKKWKLYYPED